MKKQLPPYTCDTIDEVIKKITAAYDELYKITPDMGYTDIKSTVEKAITLLYPLDTLLEEIRTANKELRNAAEGGHSVLDEIIDIINKEREA